MQKKRFFAALWALTKPYWVSEKRGTGLVLLSYAGSKKSHIHFEQFAIANRS